MLAAGNSNAPSEFLDSYGPHIRAVLRRRFSVSDDVLDDLMQAVFLHLFNNNWQVLQKWNGTSQFKTYLATVSVNKATDYLRSSWRHRTEELGEDVQPDGDDASGYALDKQIADLMRRVLDMLAERHEKCRKLLKLKYFHEFSYVEIAENMEMTTNQVGVYLKRCLERCKVLLGYESPLGED